MAKQKGNNGSLNFKCFLVLLRISWYSFVPLRTPSYSFALLRTSRYSFEGVSRSTKKCEGVRRSTQRYEGVPRNTKEYQEALKIKGSVVSLLLGHKVVYLFRYDYSVV